MWATILLFLVCFTLPAAAQASIYRSIQYRVRLELNYGDKTLAAWEEIRLRTEHPRKEFSFDAQGMEIARVTSDAPLEGWQRKPGKLVVMLKRALAANQLLTLRIGYTGKPAQGVLWGAGSVQALYHSDRWMVCDMSPGSLATLDLELDVPPGLQVAASGRWIRTRLHKGRQQQRWSQDVPVPPFVLGFVVGHLKEAFSREGATTLRFLSEKHSPDEMMKVFAATNAALRFFAEMSGVELSPGTYTQVLAAGNPMQETAQMTVLPVAYGDELLTENPAHTALLAHELAHQWWAVRVPCADWSDFWLNEGMANFMADAFRERQYGGGTYATAIEEHRQIYVKAMAAGKDHALSYHEWSTPVEASGAIPYHKGAYVLSLLRREMGDDSFWKGLKSYTRDHIGKPVTSKDLQDSMEKACDRGLQSFFDRWVYR